MERVNDTERFVFFLIGFRDYVEIFARRRIPISTEGGPVFPRLVSGGSAARL